jgi:hypothetical protein
MVHHACGRSGRNVALAQQTGGAASALSERSDMALATDQALVDRSGRVEGIDRSAE